MKAPKKQQNKDHEPRGSAFIQRMDQTSIDQKEVVPFISPKRNAAIQRQSTSSAGKAAPVPADKRKSTGDRIVTDMPDQVLMPGSRVNYKMHIEGSASNVRFKWYVLNDPQSIKGHAFRPVRYDPHLEEQEWKDAKWGFPGNHKVVCEVTYLADDWTKAYTRTFELEQKVRNFNNLEEIKQLSEKEKDFVLRDSWMKEKFSRKFSAYKLYQIYRSLGRNLETQAVDKENGDRIIASPAVKVLIPDSKISYKMHIEGEPGKVKFKWFVLNDPESIKGHSFRPRFYDPWLTKQEWENAKWDFPGKHKVVCQVIYHADDPTRSYTYFYEILQEVQDFEDVTDELFVRDLKKQPKSLLDQLLFYEKIAVQHRVRRVKELIASYGEELDLYLVKDPSSLNKLLDAWSQANLEVVKIESMYRARIPDKITPEQMTRAGTALKKFYTAFREFVFHMDVDLESAVSEYEPKMVETEHWVSNTYFDTETYLYGLARAENSWNVFSPGEIIKPFYGATHGLDLLIIDLLESEAGRLGKSEEGEQLKKDAEELRYFGEFAIKLRDLYKKGNVVKMRAVFYPKGAEMHAQAKELSKKHYGIETELEYVNLNWYVYREGKTWYLLDLTNPRNPKTNSESGGTETVPPGDLFTELDDARRFPKGRLYYQKPDGKYYSVETTEPWTLSSILMWIGIALGVLAVTVTTFGAGTPAAVTAATVLYVGAGVAGAASAIADIYEREQLGILTGKDITINVLSVAASVFSAGAMGLKGFGRVVVSQGAKASPLMARLAVQANKFYRPLTFAALGTDIVSLVVFTGDIYHQYQMISQQLEGAEQEAAYLRLLQAALLTGGLTIMAIKGGFSDLKSKRTIYLDVDEQGNIFANELRSEQQFRSYGADYQTTDEIDTLLGHSRQFGSELELQIKGEVNSAINSPGIQPHDLKEYIGRINKTADPDDIRVILTEMRTQRLRFDWGGVRGGDVYGQIAPGDAPLSNNRMLRRVEKGFVKRKPELLHGSKLSKAEGNLHHLEVDIQGTKVAVEVDIQLVDPPATAAGVHGTAQGPASFTLAFDQHRGKWVGKIEIHNTLDPDGLTPVVKHELDEIADIVHGNHHQTTLPKKDLDDIIKGQQQASVFKPGSSSTTLSAHDKATAREIKDLAEIVQRERAKSTPTALLQSAEARLQRLLSHSGFESFGGIEQKLRILAAQGIDADTMRWIRANAYVAAQQVVQGAKGSIATTRFVDHLLTTEGRGNKGFESLGLKGGHITSDFEDFITNSPEYAVAKRADTLTASTSDGQSGTVHVYDQYKQIGSGPIQSKVPKTTMDHLSFYLKYADDFYDQKIKPHIAAKGLGPGQHKVKMQNADGNTVSAYFRIDDSGNVHFETLYIDLTP